MRADVFNRLLTFTIVKLFSDVADSVDIFSVPLKVPESGSSIDRRNEINSSSQSLLP